ncbi:unnamed protein product [Chrysoparadoxa australica]
MRRMFVSRQWLRIIGSTVPFSRLNHLLCGVYLIYALRVLERQMGPRKYAVFCLLATLLSIPIELALCLRYPWLSPTHGPLPLIGALLVLFYGYVPATSALITVAGLKVGDKAVTYAIAAQLAAGDGLHSLVPMLCGACFGVLYGSDVLRLQKLSLPRILDRWLLAPPPPPRRGGPAPVHPAAGGQRGTQLLEGNALRHRQPTRAPTEPPPEETVTALMGLGFDRAQVLAALGRTGNNTEAAANVLLGG